MYRFVLLFFLSVSPVSYSYTVSDEIKGSMTCKIISTDIIENVQGQTKKYSGREGGVEVGDYAKFSYSISRQGNIFFELTDINRNKIYFASKSSTGIPDPVFKDRPPNLHVSDVFYVGQDFIEVIDKGTGIKLSRYYKWDWSGVLYSSKGFEVSITTINCQNKNDKIEEIINEVLKRPRL